MPRVRLVRHSLPPPTHEGPSEFWQLFLGHFAISKNSLCFPSGNRRVGRPLARRIGLWKLGFGNWHDDGRAVSYICHSLVFVRQAVSQAYNEPTLVVRGSFPIHESRCGVASRLPLKVSMCVFGGTRQFSWLFAALAFMCGCSDFGRNKLIF